MSNFLYDSYVILNKVYSEGAYLKQAISSVDIEEKNKPLTVKICYGVLENDLLLSYMIKTLAEKSPKLVIRTILKQSMYLIKFTNKPAYTVTNEAVELVKKLGKGGASGFVNSYLRKFARFEFEFPTEEVKSLSLKYSYPEFAVKKLIKTYGKAEAEEIMAYKTDKVCIRFKNNFVVENEYKINNKLEETPFKNVYLSKNFVRDGGFFNGEYTYQAIGSVAICNIVEPCENLLDACAAPGGKSVYLAEKCKNVTAFELHSHRVELITSYKNRMNGTNIFEFQKDMTILDTSLFQKFDGALLDVPCSGFGVAHENPDIKINKEEKDILEIIKTQQKILSVGKEYVKIGGYLYYSTCSIFEEENKNIIQNFLKENKNYKLESIKSPLNSIDTGFGLQFLPNISSGAGFFISKLKRIS